ncbi:helix-turn-helix transcriptional regulator [Roseateles chitinivorans]|uniref:AraC family transcriptional regulator n=1 Tax=Roseateles chitinivorans TaxID=2917965 RepID=UPI003D67507E
MSILAPTSPLSFMEPHLAWRAELGITAAIRQHSSVEIKRLYIEQPILIVVARGAKQVRWDGGECRVLPGQAVAVAGGQAVDITNHTDAVDYCAYWLMWDRSLLDEHAARHSEQAPVRGAQFIGTLKPDLVDAFTRARASLGDDTIPQEICRLRLQEVLVWLGLSGVRFNEREFSSMSTRVRTTLSRDIGRSWSAPDVARELATSEATLRRKLAQEATSFSDILLDTQMSHALRMLQSSMRPITEIALGCGFQTPSHFSARFRQRFGFTPSAIRVHQRDPCTPA